MNDHKPYVWSEYFGKMLDPRHREAIIDRCVEAVKRSGVEFEAIAFTGMSGAVIAPILASRLGKSLIVVRKPADTSTHSHTPVEGDLKATRYIIADDFVSTGATLYNIVTAIDNKFPKTFTDYDNGYPYPKITIEKRECVGVITMRLDDTQPDFKYFKLPDSEGPRKVLYYCNLAYRGE